MFTRTESPQILIAAGKKPKKIEEYVERVTIGKEQGSIVRMISPGAEIE